GKAIRRRGALLTVCGLVIVGFATTLWLYPHERTLIERARMITPIDQGKQEWSLLSDKELLVVTTDIEANDLMGSVNEEIHWKGHADLLNVVTGDRRRLEGLTSV